MNYLEALSKYYLNTYENQPFIAEDLNFIGDTRDDSFILLTPENNKWLFSERMSESYPITIQTSEFELSMDQQDQWHLITL